MGSRSSKRRSTPVESLDEQTIQELCQDTGFTQEELQAWHQNFYKDCPDGRLTLRQFEQTYAKIMGKPTQKVANYIRHMFTVYDQDKNQFIDFREFVMALSAASVVNRLRLVEMLFHVFDLDNDGKITKDEISKMLRTLSDVTETNEKRRTRRDQRNSSQSEQSKQAQFRSRIDQAFNELNANDDDHITRDEFIDWYMKSGLISDVQTTDLNVLDPSGFQHARRKSRKQKKIESNLDTIEDVDETSNQQTNVPIRHMTRMTERKSSTAFNEDDYYNGNDRHARTLPSNNHSTLANHHQTDIEVLNNTNASTITRPLNNRVTTSDEHQNQISVISNENDRWQLLFGSILDQIRSKREMENQPSMPMMKNSIIDRWKRKVSNEVEPNHLTIPVYGETNRSYFSTSDNELNSSIEDEVSTKDPDVITVRF